MADTWRERRRRADARASWPTPTTRWSVWAAAPAPRRRLGRRRPQHWTDDAAGCPACGGAHSTAPTTAAGAAPAAPLARPNPRWPTSTGDAARSRPTVSASTLTARAARPGQRGQRGHGARRRRGHRRRPAAAAAAAWRSGHRGRRPLPHRRPSAGAPCGCCWPRTRPAGRRRSTCSAPPPAPVVVAINARIADGRDPSWLWDVPFERLAGPVRRRHRRARATTWPCACATPASTTPSPTLGRRARRGRTARPGRRSTSSPTTPRSRTCVEGAVAMTPDATGAPCAVGSRCSSPTLLGTYGDGGNAWCSPSGWPVARHRRPRSSRSRPATPVPDACDIYLLGGGEDGPQSAGRPPARRRRGAAPGGRAGRRRCSRCAPASRSSAPRSSADGRAGAGLGLLDCDTDRGAGPGPSASCSSDADPDAGPARRSPASRTTAARTASARGPAARPGAAPASATATARGRRGRASAGRRSSAPTCTARRWPATRRWPTCCWAGPSTSSRLAGAPRRLARRRAPRRAPRRRRKLTLALALRGAKRLLSNHRRTANADGSDKPSGPGVRRPLHARTHLLSRQPPPTRPTRRVRPPAPDLRPGGDMNGILGVNDALVTGIACVGAIALLTAALVLAYAAAEHLFR